MSSKYLTSLLAVAFLATPAFVLMPTGLSAAMAGTPDSQFPQPLRTKKPRSATNNSTPYIYTGLAARKHKGILVGYPGWKKAGPSTRKARHR
jgi:hypothetical protein